MTCLLAVIQTEFTCLGTQRQKNSLFLLGATDSPSPSPRHTQENIENWMFRIGVDVLFLKWQPPLESREKVANCLNHLPQGKQEALRLLEWAVRSGETNIPGISRRNPAPSPVARLGVWHAWTLAAPRWLVDWSTHVPACLLEMPNLSVHSKPTEPESPF